MLPDQQCGCLAGMIRINAYSCTGDSPLHQIRLQTLSIVPADCRDRYHLDTELAKSICDVQRTSAPAPVQRGQRRRRMRRVRRDRLPDDLVSNAAAD